MKNLDPECYGNFSASKKCRACTFRASCEFYQKTAKEDSRSKLTSYEAASFLTEIAFIPNESGEDEKNIISMLAEFFSYLLELDDYTLGLLLQIMAPQHDERHLTVSRLAELHHCSRQAMHRKILDVIADRPELIVLFRNVLYKLPAARWLFLYKRSQRGRPEKK